MHRFGSLVLAILLATPASAAVVYEFRQINRSDDPTSQAAEVSGKGIIDGDRSRIEFSSGNLYPPGTYVISRRGARNVTLVSPDKRSFAEFDISAMTSQLARADIEISNLKTKLEQLPDHPTISGFPTDHYRIVTTYHITWSPGSLKLTQEVTSIVEKWTTAAFGDVSGSFFDETPFKTGNPQLDEVIGAETAKIKGLPLRQVVTTTTRGVGNLERTSTQLPTRPARTQSAEILLSNVRMESVPEALFEVPRDFKPVGKSDEGPKMHIISLEPESPGK